MDRIYKYFFYQNLTRGYSQMRLVFDSHHLPSAITFYRITDEDVVCVGDVG